jgi:hypothetical protein
MSQRSLTNSLTIPQQSSSRLSQGPTNFLDPTNQDEVHVKFMDRDLSGEEVTECQQKTQEYIHNDSYEIEIQNLNEVNEYFRIFKDLIIEKDAKHVMEISELRKQVDALK